MCGARLGWVWLARRGGAGHGAQNTRGGGKGRVSEGVDGGGVFLKAMEREE